MRRERPDELRRRAREQKRKRKGKLREYELKNRDRVYADKRQRRKTDEWQFKSKARTALWTAIGRGHLARAKSLACHDCGKPAQHYDHYLGYAREHWLDVQPVCTSCHGQRAVDRKELVRIKD